MKTNNIVVLKALIVAGVLATTVNYNNRAADFTKYAHDFKQQLAEKVLPYWNDTAVDRVNGGYILSDSLKGRGVAKEKQLVTQSRMIWGFSHSHLKGFSTAQRNYLEAADIGYKFLMDYFYDKQNGGYFWKTDIQGNVINDRKILYGESFVIYALVEYYRASGKVEPLIKALELFEVIQKKAYDKKNGGWYEHFTPDWTPILEPGQGAEVEVPGYKSANTHLHLMEALAELYEAANNFPKKNEAYRVVKKKIKETNLREALIEAVNINKKYFYPKNPGDSCFHRKPDWKEVTDPKSAGLSYGHNVEFAWLMIRAETVLRKQPSWAHFEAHLNHSLKYGYDHNNGGLYYLGYDDRPASKREKIWWVQSEMLAALTDALKHKYKKEYADALEKLLNFLIKYQINPEDGIWIDTLSEDGKVVSPAKAHSWKANYHDLRAIIKFVEAFSTPTKSK